MTKSASVFLAALTLSASGLVNAARADCESDLVMLENAYKTPTLTADARKALDGAKTKAVRALKADDDKTCHDAVVGGLQQAGAK